MASSEEEQEEFTAMPLIAVATTDEEFTTTTTTNNINNNNNNDTSVEDWTTVVTTNPMTKLQVSLLQTLSDIQIRSEVQDCLDFMLLDVETTFYLQQQLELRATKHALETAKKHHQATIFEADAERQARDNEQVALADQMVQEVMALSRELQELLQWKRDHAHKVDEYEHLLAQLAQTEEELQLAKEKISQHPISPAAVSASAASATSTAQQTVTGTEQLAKDNMEPFEAEPTSENDANIQESITETLLTQTSSKEETLTEVPQPEEEDMEDSKPPAVQTETPTISAAVTLDHEDLDTEVPGLVDLDVELLMTIFGFLDAVDILNMAQINISMYSKIDNIFGISEDGQSPPQPAPTRTASTATSTTTSTVAAMPPVASNNPSTQAPVTSPTPVSNPQNTPATGPIGNRLFSMLQPARAGIGTKRQSQGLNPTVAQSMASKLSDAELAAILSMTDKLHKLDKEVNMLRDEKDALSSKLDGTEAVKQFLINKVRDIEIKLAKSREDEIKVTQQIASDQEVIAFLDSRVQELERQTETLTKDKSRTQSELDTLKVQTSKKITMLNDMLKYEREKLKDDEGEWKATKKVLVKEVKSCRAQILALQAERDGLKEQNEMLKRAIVSTGKSLNQATSPLR